MEEKEKRTHMEHCFTGEYELTCKYGDNNCPVKRMIEDRDEEEADIFFSKMSKLNKLELRRRIERMYNEIKDLTDLKKLIDITVHFISMEIEADKYLGEMGK